MTRHINIVPIARRELYRILRWLRKRSPQGAASWYQAFWKAATRIADHAESYPLAEEADDLPRPVWDALFKTPKGRRYRIVFVFNEAEVFILRIRRPGQRPLRARDLPL
jgi:hypothetical protein